MAVQAVFRRCMFMTDIFATIIVPAAQAQAARDAAAQIPGGEGMFTAGLSASGSEPATHFISSGWIPTEIIEAVSGLCDVSDVAATDVVISKGLKPCVSG